MPDVITGGTRDHYLRGPAGFDLGHVVADHGLGFVPLATDEQRIAATPFLTAQ